MRSGAKNSICDIGGLQVGHAQDEKLKSGVTVVLCEEMFPASVAVHGGGPGTRDTELLRPENTIVGADAFALSGGSAFGLDSASGVQSWLRENGRGVPVGNIKVPIVPGAILFDLINGGDKDWGRYPPYRELGYLACQSAGTEFELGSAGAGTGCLVAGLKGGLGSASLKTVDGITIAALFAVNSLGNPLIGETGHFHATLFERNGEFGGHGLPPDQHEDLDELRIKFREIPSSAANTTIGLVATDAELSKAQLKRLAIAAHDGIARAIWPAHTPMDGDLVFAVATGRSGKQVGTSNMLDLSAHACSVTARAIARGVFEASASQGDLFATYADTFDEHGQRRKGR